MRVQGIALSNGRPSYGLIGPTGYVQPVGSYLAYLTNIERSPNTVRAYALDLKLWFEFLDTRGHCWEAATLELVGEFTAWLRSSRSRVAATNVVQIGEPPLGRAPKTVNRALSALFGFYEFHHDLGLPLASQLVEFRTLRHDYKRHLGRRAERRRPIHLPEQAASPKTLNESEIERILDSCTHLRDRLLISFWWLAGLRVGQTLGLRHSDFDGRRRQLRIVPRSNSQNGARPKVREEHTLPLRDELVRLHADYLHEEYGETESDHLLVNLWSPPLGAPMTYSTVDGLVRRLRLRSGVHFTPHMLRHTFATDLHRRGVRLEVVSRLLTHRSTQTTSDLYLHLDVEDMRSELKQAGVTS